MGHNQELLVHCRELIDQFSAFNIEYIPKESNGKTHILVVTYTTNFGSIVVN